jgi:hypothetical protein
MRWWGVDVGGFSKYLILRPLFKSIEIYRFIVYQVDVYRVGAHYLEVICELRLIYLGSLSIVVPSTLAHKADFWFWWAGRFWFVLCKDWIFTNNKYLLLKKNIMDNWIWIFLNLSLFKLFILNILFILKKIDTIERLLRFISEIHLLKWVLLTYYLSLL